jgi:hypothetical protein
LRRTCAASPLSVCMLSLRIVAYFYEFRLSINHEMAAYVRRRPVNASAPCSTVIVTTTFKHFHLWNLGKLEASSCRDPGQLRCDTDAIAVRFVETRPGWPCGAVYAAWNCGSVAPVAEQGPPPLDPAGRAGRRAQNARCEQCFRRHWLATKFARKRRLELPDCTAASSDPKRSAAPRLSARPKHHKFVLNREVRTRAPKEKWPVNHLKTSQKRQKDIAKQALNVLQARSAALHEEGAPARSCASAANRGGR